MKPELLEPLLLDRALGELSPSVAALLDAHLAQNPDAARRASAFALTLQLARVAAAPIQPAPPPPRPLDLARLQREQHPGHRPSHRAELLRLAACLALGTTAGWLVRSGHDRPAISTPSIAAASSPTTIASTPFIAPAPRTSEPSTHFWSIARFAPESVKLRANKKL